MAADQWSHLEFRTVVLPAGSGFPIACSVTFGTSSRHGDVDSERVNEGLNKVFNVQVI